MTYKERVESSLIRMFATHNNKGKIDEVDKQLIEKEVQEILHLIEEAERGFEIKGELYELESYGEKYSDGSRQATLRRKSDE